MNQLILLGNVGADAEVHKFENNRFAIRFSLAVTESWKDNQGVKQSKTEWFRCVRYANSEALAPYIKKGIKLLVVGKANAEAYLKDGEAIAVNTCVVKDINFLDTLNAQNQNGSNKPDIVEEEMNNDLPF
nr:single-stranded DNA-binding protein [uncultured Flavobacterium sp.]